MLFAVDRSRWLIVVVCCLMVLQFFDTCVVNRCLWLLRVERWLLCVVVVLFVVAAVRSYSLLLRGLVSCVALFVVAGCR